MGCPVMGLMPLPLFQGGVLSGGTVGSRSGRHCRPIVRVAAGAAPIPAKSEAAEAWPLRAPRHGS